MSRGKKSKFRVSKSLADKIMSFDSKTRGVVFNTDASFVRNHYSEKHLERVMARLMELGYPIDYDHVMNTKWYPSGLRVLSILVIKEVCGLTDADLVLMGDDACKISFFIRLMAKFINTIDLVVKRAGDIWARQVTRGEIVLERSSKHSIKVLFKDFNVHDDYLTYLRGYFRRVVQFNLPREKVKCKLVKGFSKKRNYAEFKITW